MDAWAVSRWEQPVNGGIIELGDIVETVKTVRKELP